MKDFQNFSDQNLLALVQSEANQLAFEELYARYWKSLLGLSLKLLDDPEISKDCVQEVFVSLWFRQQNPIKSPISDLRAFLFKAVRFQIANQMRGDRIKAEHIDLYANLDLDNRLEENLHAVDLQNQIDTLVQTMPNRTREVFILSRFQHQNNQEIAAALEISLSTVENHINKALRILREGLEKSGQLAFLLPFLLH
ncbi:sigma-70 family RNA polymerase sigma factor [Croceimicrobium hydrocarbonivorans]|uniref:Sigma-70 family RNA polymerase sigma factor n=1 Tax=Croceimicrobium hydrocarbonivorans TaxID=2761580 RepID=A0A7H0VD67_9FLAO|nr:sigma-70 family RNA polymerase sigma factor [Croceimicrobium hydrocarbonivorans]QNR23665.1 sigma-70 family RNA polymerase sigma factor [Croceimicrobium hydrocarbonivorans]